MNNLILCIEDHPDNMLLFRRVLESAGYRLLQAKSGWEGLALAEREDPALILLDINLPDLDGYEIARRLRKSPKSALRMIPIIVVSANALKGDAQKALEAGANAYMTKPIDIHALSEQVNAYLPLSK